MKVQPCACAKLDQAAPGSMSSQAISHAQRATRLYRRALKNTLSWYIDRALWREQALKLRARFDANKHLRDRRAIQALLEAGEEELQKEIHPDPYLGKGMR